MERNAEYTSAIPDPSCTVTSVSSASSETSLGEGTPRHRSAHPRRSTYHCLALRLCGLGTLAALVPRRCIPATSRRREDSDG